MSKQMGPGWGDFVGRSVTYGVPPPYHLEAHWFSNEEFGPCFLDRGIECHNAAGGQWRAGDSLYHSILYLHSPQNQYLYL